MSPGDERAWNLWDESPPPRPVEHGLVAGTTSERQAKGLGGSIVRRVLDRCSPGVANRGRAYARAGQTASLRFEPGRMVGEVQGSEAVPYRTEITFPVTDADRGRFERAVRDTRSDDATTVPETMSRALLADLAEHRILVDAPLTVKCNCAYRGVCKHLVAFAYVAGEQLDASPVNIANALGVTDADLADPGPATDGQTSEDIAVSTFDRRRQAVLARTLRALERRDGPNRDEVLGQAAEVLLPPPTVASALDLDLYLDPVEPE
jgi:uncharacterized Zn finger protein